MTLNLNQATYTEPEAAEILGLHPRTLRRRRMDKEIGFLRDGRWIRYTREDIENYAAGRAVAPRPKVNDVRVAKDAIRRYAK